MIHAALLFVALALCFAGCLMAAILSPLGSVEQARYVIGALIFGLAGNIAFVVAFVMAWKQTSRVVK